MRVPSFKGKAVEMVIDVRSRLEFFMGHLSGAVCIPVQVIAEQMQKREIGAETRILVYCASGARSAAAARQLRTLGYRNVVDGGGFAAARAEFDDNRSGHGARTAP
jgi:phage shock protein E